VQGLLLATEPSSGRGLGLAPFLSKKGVGKLLCYKCFIKLGGNAEEWDRTPCDPTKKKACGKCGLMGVFVREIEVKGGEKKND